VIHDLLEKRGNVLHQLSKNIQIEKYKGYFQRPNKQKKMNCKTEMKPTENHLIEIKKWLQNEHNKNGEGFFDNWKKINNSFESKNLAIYLKDNTPIGFATIYGADEILSIDIFCIQLNLRGKGYGGLFLKELLNACNLQQLKAINLFCDPIRSESFWKKQGFLKAPDTPFNTDELRYWKPLVPAQQATMDNNFLNKIELWDEEPIYATEKSPKWTWELTSDCSNIIQYAYYDWNLRITVNGKIVNEAKAKKITDKLDEFIKSSFIYIPQDYIRKLITSK
jgi:hypothetical protein